MIEYELQQSVSNALKQLYNHDVAPENIVLQKTKKEFEGDFIQFLEFVLVIKQLA